MLSLFIEQVRLCNINILTHTHTHIHTYIHTYIYISWHLLPTLPFFTKPFQGRLGVVKGSYHMTRTSPSGPEHSTCINLYNFKELDFSHLHPDGGGHWGRFGFCDLAWSSWWCSKPCLSCFGYDTGMLNLRSGKTTGDWLLEGKQKKKIRVF